MDVDIDVAVAVDVMDVGPTGNCVGALVGGWFRVVPGGSRVSVFVCVCPV